MSGSQRQLGDREKEARQPDASMITRDEPSGPVALYLWHERPDVDVNELGDRFRYWLRGYVQWAYYKHGKTGKWSEKLENGRDERGAF